MKIRLVVGDWSGDGHEKKENFIIESNLNKKEIEKAYKKGAKAIGIDITKNIARKYEDSAISKEDFKKFQNKGFDEYELEDNYADEKSYLLTSDDFLDLYLFTIKIGNENFKFEILNDDCDTINIGGYGLFQ